MLCFEIRKTDIENTTKKKQCIEITVEDPKNNNRRRRSLSDTQQRRRDLLDVPLNGHLYCFEKTKTDGNETQCKHVTMKCKSNVPGSQCEIIASLSQKSSLANSAIKNSILDCDIPNDGTCSWICESTNPAQSHICVKS